MCRSIEKNIREIWCFLLLKRKEVRKLADGSIRIDTKINRKGAEQGLEELKKTADAKVRQLEQGVAKAGKEVENLNSKFSDTSRELESVEQKMDMIGDRIFETYKDFQGGMSEESFNKFIQGQIQADSEYKKLISEQEQLKIKAEGYKKKLGDAKSNQTQLNSSLQIAKKEQSETTQKLEESKKKAKSLGENLKKAKNESKALKTESLGISNSIGKGISKILKYGAALVGIRSIYQGLKSSASAWLNSGAEGTKQLKTDIDSITVAIGSGLQPVIQFIYNTIIKILGVVASLIKAFTGVNIFANATSKNLSSATGNAKKLKKELSSVGFDEQEKLQDNSSDSSSSGGGGLAPSVDYTKLADQFADLAQKIKSILDKILEPFKMAWEKTGQEVIDAWYNALDGIKSLILAVGKSFEEIWTNGTVQTTAELLLKIVADILNIIGNISRAFANAWEQGGKGTSIIQSLANAFNNILAVIESVLRTFAEWWKTDKAQAFANAVVSIFETISGWIENITANIKKIWDNGGQQAFTSLLDAGSNIAQIFAKILEAIDQLVQGIENVLGDTLAGLLDAIGWIVDKFNEFADWILGNSESCDFFAVIIGSIATAILLVVTAMEAWNIIGAIATAVTTGLGVAIQFLTSPITLVTLAIAAIIAIIVLLIQNWDTVSAALTAGWEWLKEKAIEIFTAIGEFFSNIWNSIKETASNIWNAIKEFFSDTWNNIKETATTIFNKVKTSIVDIFTNIKTKAQEIWENIKSVVSEKINNLKTNISNTLNNIKTVWENIWNSLKTIVTNIWDGIWGAIKNVINSILSGIEAMANGIVRGVNKIIDTLNNLQIHIPDWVPMFGNKSIGFHINHMGEVSLPRLARGGIAMQPTQAIVGEAGKEAILPLQNNTEWMNDMAEIFADKIREVLEELDFGETIVNNMLDGELMQRVFARRSRNKNLATNGRCS